MILAYIIALAVAALAILMGVILGEAGPWYFSWFLGTGFMILAAAAGGILLEAQEEADAARQNPTDPAPPDAGNGVGEALAKGREAG